jgi:hypothetical protein
MEGARCGAGRAGPSRAGLGRHATRDGSRRSARVSYSGACSLVRAAACGGLGKRSARASWPSWPGARRGRGRCLATCLSGHLACLTPAARVSFDPARGPRLAVPGSRFSARVSFCLAACQSLAASRSPRRVRPQGSSAPAAAATRHGDALPPIRQASGQARPGPARFGGDASDMARASALSPAGLETGERGAASGMRGPRTPSPPLSDVGPARPRR